MRVKDLISKISDNYQKIKISEIHESESIVEEWTIYPHSTTIYPHSMSYENIPEYIWNKEIYSIALYYYGLYITVQDK